MTTSYDLTIRQGDTWRSPRWALVIGDQAIDLTNEWTIEAQARAYPQARAVLWSWSTGDGIELGTAQFTVDEVPVTGSTVRLHLTAEQSSTLDVFAGVWDLEVNHPTFDNGAPYRKTIVSGRIRIVAEVTQ